MKKGETRRSVLCEALSDIDKGMAVNFHFNTFRCKVIARNSSVNPKYHFGITEHACKKGELVWVTISGWVSSTVLIAHTPTTGTFGGIDRADIHK